MHVIIVEINKDFIIVIIIADKRHLESAMKEETTKLQNKLEHKTQKEKPINLLKFLTEPLRHEYLPSNLKEYHSRHINTLIIEQKQWVSEIDNNVLANQKISVQAPELLLLLNIVVFDTGRKKVIMMM